VIKVLTPLPVYGFYVAKILRGEGAHGIRPLRVRMSDCRVSLILVFEYTPKCNDRGVLVLAIRLLEPWILEPSLVSTPQLSTIAWTISAFHGFLRLMYIAGVLHICRLSSVNRERAFSLHSFSIYVYRLIRLTLVQPQFPCSTRSLATAERGQI